LIRVIAAELLKLRTTRTFWALAGSAIGLVLLIVVLTLALDDHLDTEQDVTDLISTAGLSGLLTLVLGVVVGAGEYRHGTIAATLLVTPNRLRAVAAQVIACFIGGLAISLAAVAGAMTIALPWLSAKGVPLPSAGELAGDLIGGVGYAGLAAALGAALGALLRNQVAAVVSLLVLIFVVDPVIAGLLEDVAPFTLTGLGAAMSGASGDDNTDLLSPGVAAVVWAGYASLLAVLAAISTSRRDI
jgi:ABC-type transport system involved in multi-copper enzyme maturation permease subunit